MDMGRRMGGVLQVGRTGLFEVDRQGRARMMRTGMDGRQASGVVI
jgi:hypothetical protein